MICNCSLARTAACKNCPSHKWEEEGRFPSKVFFAYGVDAVEVVRCGECKHFYVTKFGNRCMLDHEEGMNNLPPDWFCADGERKGEEDERKPLEMVREVRREALLRGLR